MSSYGLFNNNSDNKVILKSTESSYKKAILEVQYVADGDMFVVLHDYDDQVEKKSRTKVKKLIKELVSMGGNGGSRYVIDLWEITASPENLAYIKDNSEDFEFIYSLYQNKPFKFYASGRGYDKDDYVIQSDDKTNTALIEIFNECM